MGDICSQDRSVVYSFGDKAVYVESHVLVRAKSLRYMFGGDTAIYGSGVSRIDFVYTLPSAQRQTTTQQQEEKHTITSQQQQYSSRDSSHQQQQQQQK